MIERAAPARTTQRQGLVAHWTPGVILGVNPSAIPNSRGYTMRFTTRHLAIWVGIGPWQFSRRSRACVIVRPAVVTTTLRVGWLVVRVRRELRCGW